MDFLNRRLSQNDNFLSEKITNISNNDDEPETILTEQIEPQNDELWTEKTLQLFKYYLRNKNPQTIRQWTEITKSMNRACRHPEILQYSPKDLLEKKEKLDDNDSWDFIYDITTEPPVNYPPKPVRVHIFSIPKTNSNLCPQLVEARSNYEIWEKRLQGTWQDFWTYEENEKVLQKALKVVKPGTTHFYEDVVNFLNKYGKYPRQLKQNSLQRDEVMRKCWEKSEFTKNILHTILADENSLKKYHYAGVVGRQKEQRMADHEQTHGKCDFRKHESTSDKQTCLVTEIISISLLMSMENFALIGGCLNRSAGGDGSTAATTYRSEMYHNYSYDTMTPFEAQNSDQGHLRRVVTYKKMPEKFNKNGSRIIHAFCMTCYRWIHPLKLKTHNKRHYSKNVKCLECPRKFKTELSMKYHLKMSHTFVRCKKNHHNVRVNKTLSVDSWIRYHLTMYHMKEIDLFEVKPDQACQSSSEDDM